MLKLAKPEAYGWNENGEYFKFPDGTLIVSTTVSLEAGETHKVVYFPIPFANQNYKAVASNIYSYGISTMWSVTNNDANYMAVYPYGNEGVARSANVIAIGRWK